MANKPEHNPKKKQSKLTPDAVREARELRKAGVKYLAIASQFGVDEKAVWNAINYRTWKYVR